MDEAKTHLSKRVAALKPGDRIILCRRNRPVAEIRPLAGRPDAPRPFGLGKGIAKVSDAFFEPLPKNVIDDFEGIGR